MFLAFTKRQANEHANRGLRLMNHRRSRSRKHKKMQRLFFCPWQDASYDRPAASTQRQLQDDPRDGIADYENWNLWATEVGEWSASDLVPASDDACCRDLTPQY